MKVEREQIAYLMDNRYHPGFYCTQIRKRCIKVDMNFYPTLGEFVDKILFRYVEAPFVSVRFYFFEPYELLKLAEQQSPIRQVLNFITEEKIDKVRMHFVPISSPKENYQDLKTHDNFPIIQHCFRGKDIRLKKHTIYNKLMEIANTLNILRNIYVSDRYMNPDDFFENFMFNLLDHFRGDHGSIALWETSERHKKLHKKIFSTFPLINYDFETIPKLTSKESIIYVDEIENEKLRNELNFHKVSHHILIPVRSEHYYGYFDFFSKLGKISSADHELIKSIQKHIPLILENTYFFQKMLIREGAITSFFKNTQEAIMIVDPNRLVVDINESTVKLTGWTKEEAIGKPCKMLFQSCGLNGISLCNSIYCPMLIPLHNSKCVTKQKICTVDKFGNRGIVKSDYYYNNNVMDGLIYGMAIVRDLTEHVKLEEKLQHFEQLAAFGKFAAELAHEIRNPITGITSNAQFLFEDPNLQKEHQEIIEEILQGSHIIEQTVKKLLKLAIPSKPVFETNDINDVINDVIGFLKKRIERANIKLKFSLAQDLPYIRMEPDLIRQVFMNIIMNSIEAMEDGGYLEVITGLIQESSFSYKKEEKCVQVIIRDSGCGISVENLEKIFNPFFTTKPTGSGLGLYSADKILRDHDTCIEASSKVNEGTTMSIKFKIPL